MKIGIIGLGMVGKTLKYCFEYLGHDVVSHDIVLDTKIEDVLDTELCYICVPTPSKETGECDTRIVEDVVCGLDKLKYQGVVAIKSTIIPGTTDELLKRYNLKICHVPEFLREKHSISDFTENHDICVVGTNDIKIFDIVKKSHGKYPKKFMMLNPSQSELLKYFHNVHNATMIVLANVFYQISNHLDVEYNDIKNSLVTKSFISDRYLNCNKNLKGFSGSCLPKDLKSINFFCEKNNLNIKFFENIIQENNKFL